MSYSLFKDITEINRVSEINTIEELKYNTKGNLLTYNTFDSLKIFTNEGILKNIINVNIDKYSFFQENTILHSNKAKLFYLSIYDNKYLKVFDNNTENIRSISTDNLNDIFMTNTKNKICIYDIRMNNPVKEIENNSCLSCLSKDNLYCVLDPSHLYIFDKRYDKNNKGLVIKSIKNENYREINFSPDNSLIWMKTNNSYYFYKTTGDLYSCINLESETDGQMTQDCKHLLCTSRKWIFSYNIRNRVKEETLDSKNNGKKKIRCSPEECEFTIGSENMISVYKY